MNCEIESADARRCVTSPLLVLVLASLQLFGIQSRAEKFSVNRRIICEGISKIISTLTDFHLLIALLCTTCEVTTSEVPHMAQKFQIVIKYR